MTFSFQAFQSQIDNLPSTRIQKMNDEIGVINKRKELETARLGTPDPIQYRSDGATSFDGGRTFSGGNTSNSSSSLGFNGDLQNVFTNLGNIAETKAQNDQRRFREDLPFQSRIYQDFDTEAAQRTEGIDTRAREQNSNLTKDRMRLQSQQNIAEEQNRGKVQVSTTGQTRDADLKRALSVLPRK